MSCVFHGQHNSVDGCALVCVGVKKREFLHHPNVTPQTSHLGAVVAAAVMSGTVRHRRAFLDHVQEATMVQDQWKNYAR